MNKKVTLTFTEGVDESGFGHSEVIHSLQIYDKAADPEKTFGPFCSTGGVIGNGAPLLGIETMSEEIPFDPAITDKVIHYCVYDNAGNTRSEKYPSSIVHACFADETSSVNLDTYE